ncbi:hypothetical protein QBC43DRAFT_304129 [Cladorrhinum sp. PSN259]|nr:hypothetical protein QBC43DRAFT_304129 [Cladorrhinum sp. PSN259]
MLLHRLRPLRWRTTLSVSLNLRSPVRFYAVAHENSVEHVRVRCRSSGDITVTLHNIAKYPSTTPLMIVLPPFASQASDLEPRVALPAWLHEYPTAVINYRWQPLPLPEELELDEEDPLYDIVEHRSHHSKVLTWPSPIHDVLFGYTWLSENLVSPPFTEPTPSDQPQTTPPSRPAYVYGSYIGASLAASLALTESHSPPNPGLNVRGLIAHNGIYNWTTFLPDHPINNPTPSSKFHKNSHYHQQQHHRRRAHNRDHYHDVTPKHHEFSDPSPAFNYLSSQIPILFPSPSSLFDPFISASLLFHSPPLHVPKTFDEPTDPTYVSNPNTNRNKIDADDYLRTLPQPGIGTLRFPPISPPPDALKIPFALFLHDCDDDGSGRNGFESQARDLAYYMRQSVEKWEWKERIGYVDGDHAGWLEKMERAKAERRRRVKVVGLNRHHDMMDEEEGEGGGGGGGGGGDSWGLDERAEDEVRDWVGGLVMEDAENEKKKKILDDGKGDDGRGRWKPDEWMSIEDVR